MFGSDGHEIGEGHRVRREGRYYSGLAEERGDIIQGWERKLERGDISQGWERGDIIQGQDS